MPRWEGLDLLAPMDIHILAASGSYNPDHQLDDEDDKNQAKDYLHAFQKPHSI